MKTIEQKFDVKFSKLKNIAESI
ncbi:uncharacterized protein METZ01_LOCUS160513 [marine metagenome]|uniref:Uncharacterized protein n=1 Tax=marine metagenome TaxID=408172 RepID=A0A382B1R8_9ZZZZ